MAVGQSPAALRTLVAEPNRLRSVLPLAAFLSLLSTPARAACNIIPGTTQTFRASQTTIDRPYAGPGDFVTLGLDPTCYTVERTFSTTATDQVVTVIFTPPQRGPRNVVMLASSARCAAVGASTCPGAVTTCLPIDRPQHPIAVEVTDPQHLRFPFPDTDALVREATDALTLTGPASIAVTQASDPVPCGLVTEPCTRQSGLLACVDTLFAADGTCGTTPDPTFPHFTALPFLNNYQALCTDVPPAGPCQPVPVRDLRFTVDTAGNLLIPVDWGGVRVDPKLPIARPVRGNTPLEAVAGTGKAIHIPDSAFLSSFDYSTGRKLPPIFDPQTDRTDSTTLFGTTDALRAVLRVARRTTALRCAGGSAADHPCGAPSDCPGGTCAPRFLACTTGDGTPCTQDQDCGGAAGSCGEAACHDGARAGQPCRTDTDCPGGECGVGIFVFADRFLDGTGPVVLRAAPGQGTGTCVGGSNALATCSNSTTCPGGQCATFEARALDPVPLDGLIETQSTFAFVKEEAIDGQDLNGDGDATDHVVTLVDRTTGRNQAIGAVGPQGRAEGRAVARIRQPPFSFPAVAAEGEVVAFLEPEPAQGNQDANGNGTVFDTVLRVFRLGSDELTSDRTPITADAAPMINGRSLAISNGRVFFRTVEARVARQQTEIVSTASDGTQGNDLSSAGILSGDGRFVAFFSDASNLVSDDTNGTLDVFIHDRITRTTERVSVASDGTQANGGSGTGVHSISADGRFVVFDSLASDLVAGDTNAVEDAFVRDRCVSDGNPVAGCTPHTERASVASDGTQGNDFSFGAISADGRFVALDSVATNLVSADTNDVYDVFVHDRLTGVTELVSVAPDGTQGNRFSIQPSISADGRFIAFASDATNLVGGDTNQQVDIFVRDRCTSDGKPVEGCTPGTERVSVASDGTQGSASSSNPSISPDGRFIAFVSFASNLVSGDTNGTADLFVRDRCVSNGSSVAGCTPSTERVSVASDGAQLFSFEGSISTDGRFVAFSNFVATGATSGVGDVFVHDRLTGMTARSSVADAAGTPGNGGSTIPSISADGRFVAFASYASNLVGGDTNATADVFVRGPDRLDLSGDLDGDGDVDDTVLRVLDTAASSVAPVVLGPADATAVSGGNAVFLRPEAAGAPGQPAGIDLNADGDTTDEVVQLWPGKGPALNLRRAATAAALSDRWLAALVSEAGQGHTDFNGDGDTADTVVQIAPVTATSDADWINLGQAADTVDVGGSIVAFITPEAAQGNQDLDGDGDTTDRVLQVYDADEKRRLMGGPGAPVTARAAADFVLGPPPPPPAPAKGLVAFRASDVAGGHDVLEVFDPSTGLLCNSHQAATPCLLEACDPRVPYRVLNSTVTFLTFECEQTGPLVDAGCPTGGTDLNGNGTADDLVVQTFNVAMAEAEGMCGPAGVAVSSDAASSRTAIVPGGVQAGLVTTLAAAKTGVCTTTGGACATDANCAGGACFVPPGGCIVDRGTTCNPTESGSCPTGEFCQPTPGIPGEGTCHELQGPCRSTAECTAPAVCNVGNQNFNRLLGPLVKRNGGATVFTGAGHCVEDVGTPCAAPTDCKPGTSCEGGTCHREHGVCRMDNDCPNRLASHCEPDLVIHALEDQDGDEIPDAFDNCPTVFNPDQRDSNGNLVGDACELNRPPECTRAVAAPATLWPADGRSVSVSIQGVTDPDGDPVSVTITGITQDEPLGSIGSKCPAGVGVGGATATVRAERNGAGDGRVYHVGFVADDGRGGQCRGSVSVCVPHDQGRGSRCMDEGSLVNSSGPCPK